jgi:hypothetical protein
LTATPTTGAVSNLSTSTPTTGASFLSNLGDYSAPDALGSTATPLITGSTLSSQTNVATATPAVSIGRTTTTPAAAQRRRKLAMGARRSSQLRVLGLLRCPPLRPLALRSPAGRKVHR